MNCKLKKYTMRIFRIIFLLIFLYLIINSILNSSKMFYEMNAVSIVIWTSCFINFIYIIYKISIKMGEKNKKYTIILLFIILLLIQLIFVYYLRVGFTWDFGVNMNESIGLANGNRELSYYYWAKYPNNIGSVFLLSNIFKIMLFFNKSFTDYYLCGIIINLLIINLSILSIIYIIYKKYSLNAVIMTMMIILFITPLYSYTTIVYTDTLAMIFPVLGVLCLIIGEEKNLDIYIVISGIIFIIGSFIKTNVIIFFIALIIYVIYKYKLCKIIKYVSILMIFFISINAVYSINIQKYIPIAKKESGLPATHWIMMGLEGDGGYSSECDQFSTEIYNQFGKEATKEANLKVIKNRIKKIGFNGYIKTLKNKLDITWNDGTYFAPEKLSREPYRKDSNLFKKIVENDNKGFVYLSQVGHLILLIGIFLGSVKSLRKKCNYITFIQIAVFGNILFLLIWETRSRYLVYFIPIMIILAIDGYMSVIKGEQNE